MANVQTEAGFVKIANRLGEAVLAAPFTGQQLRVVFALMRLTYGWNRRTVQLTETELAGYAGLSNGHEGKRVGGTFRKDLRRLVEAGVVRRVEGAQGSPRCTWALQKDYSKWGAYEVGEGVLAARWRLRPTANDAALRLHQSDDNMAHAQANSDETTWPVDGPSTWPVDGPTEPETTWPDTGPTHGPVLGHVNGPKSIFGETLQRPKDRKDSSSYVVKENLTNTSNNNTGSESRAAAAAATNGKATRDDNDATQQYAIKLSTAANAGITARWGEQINPIRYTTGLLLAEKLLAADVPIEVARLTIDSVCRSSKNERPPKTLSYFEQPILEAHESNQQRALNAADPGVTGAQRGGTPRPIADVLDPAKRKRAEQLKTDYDAARRAAGIAWGSDPANAERYRAIVAQATEKNRLIISMPFGQRARDDDVILACADASGFPPFERWAQERHPPPNVPIG